jgi:hypothetical protein
MIGGPSFTAKNDHASLAAIRARGFEWRCGAKFNHGAPLIARALMQRV